MADDNLEKAEWVKDVCAGGVVIKTDDSGKQVLLVMPKGPNYGPPTGYWTFPKGKLDSDDEDKKVAALREVREEGGVDAEIVAELGLVKFFRKGNEHFSNAIKLITFYLMDYRGGNPEDHDDEIAESKFFPIEEAMGKLKFSHDKDTFKKALDHLSRQ